METLVVFSAMLTLCRSHMFTMVPSNNSHYIEDKTRYVWLPNGEGVPQLVDLYAKVDNTVLSYRCSANSEYWLYTRRNPNVPQILEHGKPLTVWKSNYAAHKPLMVIVHGWKSDGYTEMNARITSAYLAVQDANVIVVDWRILADTNYVTAANGAPIIGLFLGHFLIWLLKIAGGHWDNIHLVGFSLGAHIVGNAGRTTKGGPRRITGLDPARPLWSDYSKGISRKSGQYVEVIHTDGDRLGIFDPIGDADFYPNGGKNPQPGCRYSTCSHGRATDLFASSIRYNHFVGKQCTNISEAEEVQCNGTPLDMGNSDLSKSGSGIYGLNTTSEWPY